LSNLVLVCSYHHLLMHEGGFDVERRADGGFTFYGPDGQPLPETGRLDRSTIDALTSAAANGQITLRALNRAAGLDIDERTGACLWTGERMDYHMAVGGLIWTRNRAAECAERAAMEVQARQRDRQDTRHH